MKELIHVVLLLTATISYQLIMGSPRRMNVLALMVMIIYLASSHLSREIFHLALIIFLGYQFWKTEITANGLFTHCQDINECDVNAPDNNCDATTTTCNNKNMHDDGTKFTCSCKDGKIKNCYSCYSKLK